MTALVIDLAAERARRGHPHGRRFRVGDEVLVPALDGGPPVTALIICIRDIRPGFARLCPFGPRARHGAYWSALDRLTPRPVPSRRSR